MTSVDVVIIGGGIVGCACAYYLAKAGVKVSLYERGAIGSGASRAGMSHVVTWEEPLEHLELSRASQRLYENLCLELMAETGIDIEYRRTGSIAVVESAQGISAMAVMIERLRNWGLECQLMSENELREVEPGIAQGVAGGAYFPGDAMVNPLLVTQALARAARKYGADIQTFAEVDAIESDSSGKIAGLRIANRFIAANNIIIAAGAWSSLVGGTAGIEIPVVPRKGVLAVTAPVSEQFLRCKVILSAGYMDSIKDSGGGAAVAANIQQVKNGNILLGSTRQFAGFDLEVDTMLVREMIARCLRIMPGLLPVPIIRMWAGLRPSTPDLLPIIGPVQSMPGLYFATGHEGIGITEAPVTGWLICQMILGGKMPGYVDALSPDRFSNTVERIGC